eukprot:930356-Pelagomonas_calceolata.AAC.3
MLDAGDDEVLEGEEDDGVAPQKGARRLANRQSLMGLNKDAVELRPALAGKHKVGRNMYTVRGQVHFPLCPLLG